MISRVLNYVGQVVTCPTKHKAFQRRIQSSSPLRWHVKSSMVAFIRLINPQCAMSCRKADIDFFCFFLWRFGHSTLLFDLSRIPYAILRRSFVLALWDRLRCVLFWFIFIWTFKKQIIWTIKQNEIYVNL